MTLAAPTSDSRTALMLGEAHHRFCNGLQLIRSLAGTIARSSADDPRLRASLSTLQERVALLADVNRALAGPFGEEAISATALRRICRDLALVAGRFDTDVEVQIAGRVRNAENRRVLLLFVAELMTNALKHGAPYKRLKVRLLLKSAPARHRLDFSSNSPRRGKEASPRMLDELITAQDGSMEVIETAEAFRVVLTIPNVCPPRSAIAFRAPLPGDRR